MTGEHQKEQAAAAGLYLPTSDIDLVVMDSKCGDVPIALKALASSLLRRSMAKGIQVVPLPPLPRFYFRTFVLCTLPGTLLTHLSGAAHHTQQVTCQWGHACSHNMLIPTSSCDQMHRSLQQLFVQPPSGSLGQPIMLSRLDVKCSN